MDKLKSKLEDRADKQNKFDALVEAAKSRPLTEAEETQLSSFDGELEVLESEISKLQKIESRKAKSAAEKAAAASGAPQDNYSEAKEFKQFSYAKAVKAVSKSRGAEVQGFEKEMFDEATKEFNEAGVAGELKGNIRVPSRLVSFGPKTSAPLTVTTEGTDVVQTDFGGLINSLRIEPLVSRLGITVLSGLTGNLKYPRSNNDLLLAWEGELDSTAEMVPTFDSIDLSPNRLAGYTDVSLKMLVQSPFVMEAFIRGKIQYAYAATIDAAIINGSGTPPEPAGILNYSGVNAVSLGSVGGDMTYGALISLLTAPMADNAREGNSGWLMNTNGFAALARTTTHASGVEGNYILMPNQNTLLGHKYIVSNRVPSDLTESSGSALSAIIFSPRWESAILATWGGVDILFDPYTQALTGTARFVINAFADIDFEHPEEFAFAKDWITTVPAAT